jgi:hypothetical protein
MDLREEAEFTYNFLCHVDLTEDRTAMYPSYLEGKIADYILESNDAPFVGRATSSRRYERSLNYGVFGTKPSQTFIEVAKDSPNPTAREVAEKHLTPITPTTRIIITVPKSEVTDEELESVRAAVADILGTDIEIRDMREAA